MVIGGGGLGVVGGIDAGDRRDLRRRREVREKAGSRVSCRIRSRIYGDSGKGLVPMGMVCRLKEAVTAKMTFSLILIAF